MNALMLAGLLSLAADTVPLAAGAPPLVNGGQSRYQIVLPPQPSAVVGTAAKELQDHLRQATGATLPIVAHDAATAGTPNILLGDSPRARRLAPNVPWDSLGHDAIVLKTVGHDLILAGRPPRGTLYAVYSLLEDTVGCRWWTSTERFIPKRPRLELPALDVVYAPPLRYREAYYRDAFDGVFSARLKLNGSHHLAPPEYGGHYTFAGFVHTFYPLVPPEKHFAAHPEWYSELNGKRTAEHGQLCLTNDELRRELTQSALARLRAKPGAGLISISQNDWQGACQCAACRAVEAEEESPAGPVVRFVNAVAAELETEFPDVLVETLAYQYTRKPPKHVRPRKNVIIRLCSIECCFQQPLSEGEHNARFRADIEGWARIAPQLFIWDYVTNFQNYILPHPNLRALAPNVRYFVANRTAGLFEQGDAGTTVGDFVRMRAWLLARLMWNPALDERTLITEFLDGYYGPAGKPLAAYLDLLQDAAAKADVYLRCYMPDTAAWLPLEAMNAASKLFAAAEKAVAGDAVLAARVRRERMPLDHAWLLRYYALRREARDRGIALAVADPAALCDEFLRLATEHRAGQYREGRPFAEYQEALRRRFRPAGPPPERCRGLPADRWIDAQDNRFRLARPEWAAIVDDKAASDGTAARMPGSHFEWAVSYPLSDDLAAGVGGRWRCFVRLRCAARATSGPGLTLGIYDTATKKSVAHRRLDVAEVAGDYRDVDLGVHPLRPTMYVWVAPPKRPGEVEAVYVDRVYLLRED